MYQSFSKSKTTPEVPITEKLQDHSGNPERILDITIKNIIILSKSKAIPEVPMKEKLHKSQWKSRENS